MKRTFRGVYVTLILTAGFFALSACSTDDSTDGPSKPGELPTIDDLHVAAGDEGYIEFDAYGVWTLSSEKPWVKFDKDTDKAGSQKIKYTITADALGFGEDTAVVTLKIGNESMNFKFIRLPKGREIKFYTRVENPDTEVGGFIYKEVDPAEGVELNFVDRSANYLASFAVVANFDWKIDPKVASSVPAWISINADDRSGTASADMNAAAESLPYKWLNLNLSAAQAESMTGDITFSDLKVATATFTLKVKCAGSSDYMFSHATTTVAMNTEGKYITKVIEKDEEGNDVEKEVLFDAYEFTADAGNGGLTFFRVWNENGFYGVESGMGQFQYTANWCGVDRLPAKDKVISPAVKNFAYELWCNPIGDNTRSATIIALPAAMAEGLKEADLVASGDKEIKPEYIRYIVTEMKQEAAMGLSFEYPNGLEGITLAKWGEGSELDAVKSEYGVQMAYTITYNSCAMATSAGMRVSGVPSETLETMYVPADAELDENAGTGWLGTSLSETLTLVLEDTYVPFTGSRNAMIILKSAGTPTIVLKVVQNAPRWEE